MNFIYGIMIFVAGIVLPIFLLPLIAFTGYSEILEEVAKCIIVLFLILRIQGIGRKVLSGVMFGFLFGVSESVLYIGNILEAGDFGVFWQRFVFTVPMHIITVLLMVLPGAWKKPLAIIGLFLSIMVHLVFNVLVVKGVIS